MTTTKAAKAAAKKTAPLKPLPSALVKWLLTYEYERVGVSGKSGWKLDRAEIEQVIAIAGSPEVEDQDDRQARISSIQHNHARAVSEVRTQARWLREAADQAERDLDTAHTPGNITACAGRLDAAREKAWVLRETLEVLGAYVKPGAPR